MNAQNFMDLLEWVDQNAMISVGIIRSIGAPKANFCILSEARAGIGDNRSKTFFQAIEKIIANLPIITTPWWEQRKNSTIPVREALNILRNS